MPRYCRSVATSTRPILFLALCAVALGLGLHAARPAAAAGYVVTTTADSGAGSLRQAILDAEANANASDSISFSIPANQPGCTAANVCTITLGSPLPILTDSFGLIIDGTGAKITVSGNGQHCHLIVSGGSTPASLTLVNLTLIDGYALGNGGSITIGANAVVNVYNSTFADNEAEGVPGSGGAIYNLGSLNVYNSTFAGN